MATKTIHWEGAIRDLSGEDLYVQVISLTTGALLNAAEEDLDEAVNGHRSVAADIGSATGQAAIVARYDSDDDFAASGFLNLDEDEPVVNEAVIDLDALADAIPASTIQPYSAHAPQRVNGTKLTAFLGEGDDVSITVTCYDASKALLPLTGRTLRYSVAPHDDPKNPFYTSDPFTGSGSTFALVLNALATAEVAIDGEAHEWSLREGTEVIQYGRIEVKETSVGASS